jgi:hypothetical protein
MISVDAISTEVAVSVNDITGEIGDITSAMEDVNELTSRLVAATDLLENELGRFKTSEE